MAVDIAEAAKSFFSAGSLLTFGGASVAVVSVSNAYQRLVGNPPPVVAFATALIITFAGAVEVDQLHGFFGWLIAFLNSCLLFSSAAGLHTSVIAQTTTKPPDKTQTLGLPKQQGGQPPRSLRAPWFR